MIRIPSGRHPMNKPIPKELIYELEKLDADDQVRVIDYI